MSTPHNKATSRHGHHAEHKVFDIHADRAVIHLDKETEIDRIHASDVEQIIGNDAAVDAGRDILAHIATEILEWGTESGSPVDRNTHNDIGWRGEVV